MARPFGCSCGRLDNPVLMFRILHLRLAHILGFSRVDLRCLLYCYLSRFSYPSRCPGLALPSRHAWARVGFCFRADLLRVSLFTAHTVSKLAASDATGRGT